MSSYFQKKLSPLEIVGWTWPTLHEGVRWYVEFMCVDASGKRRRKRYSVPKLGRVMERRMYAQEMILSLAAKLRTGWNPYLSAGGKQVVYMRLDVLERRYHLYLSKLEKVDSLKKSSFDSYLSYSRIFFDWCRNSGIEVIEAVDGPVVSEFLDHLLLDKEVSARTRNNYLVWLQAFFGWCVEKRYCSENPASLQKKLKENEKRREQLDASQLSRLRSYLTEHNRHFLLACMLEYYTFIRPEELCSVKIGDISVKDQSIRLRAANTKNRKDGRVGVNRRIIELMLELSIFSHPSGSYLFGNRDFTPSPRRQTGRIFREYFAKKVRPALRWPTTVQFYSLKDSGIRDLANAEGIVIARDQARHSDISTTNKYLKGDALAVHEETKEFEGYL